MILEVTCKRCGVLFFMEHEPNEFVPESFVRGAAVCDKCAGHTTKRGTQEKKTPEKKAVTLRLPYAD